MRPLGDVRLTTCSIVSVHTQDDSTDAPRALVFCTTQGKTVSAGSCAGCSQSAGYFQAEGGGIAHCWTLPVVTAESCLRRHGEADLREASLRARVGDLVTRRCCEPTMGDAVTPAHSLPENSPVAFAIGLMASERLGQLPILGEGGRMVGMLTAADVLGWVARAIGYVFLQSETPS